MEALVDAVIPWSFQIYHQTIGSSTTSVTVRCNYRLSKRALPINESENVGNACEKVDKSRWSR